MFYLRPHLGLLPMQRDEKGDIMSGQLAMSRDENPYRPRGGNKGERGYHPSQNAMERHVRMHQKKRIRKTSRSVVISSLYSLREWAQRRSTVPRKSLPSWAAS